MTGTAVIHVIDDDDSLRVAVTRLLRAAGYEVRGYASAGDYLLAEPEDAPGCLLLDVQLPGPSGLELQDALARRRECLPIVFLTGHGDIPTSVRALKAGAVDFLTKPVRRDALLAAVASAVARHRREREALQHRMRRRSLLESLTARERDVFRGVVAGRLNKQIAAELCMAERTVKAHRAQVMRKLGASSVAELVRIAGELEHDLQPSSADPEGT